MVWVKRIIVFLVVAFALFYLIAQPQAAADAVRAIFGALSPRVPLADYVLPVTSCWLTAHGHHQLARSARRQIHLDYGW